MLICFVDRFVGPITLRRTLLQFLATVLKKRQYAPALAGTAIAIHMLYGLAVAKARPYTDTEDGAHTNSFDNLDKLSIFHSVVQVLLLVVGLAANKENGVAVAVAVFLLGAAAMAGSAVVFRARAGKGEQEHTQQQPQAPMDGSELCDSPAARAHASNEDDECGLPQGWRQKQVCTTP